MAARLAAEGLEPLDEIVVAYSASAAATFRSQTRRGDRPARSRHESIEQASVGRSHTAAVHLLEAGVEVNVIRGWLGHADLTTTNRYVEINTKAKIEALRNTEPPGTSAGPRARPVWRTDEALLNWLSSL